MNQLINCFREVSTVLTQDSWVNFLHPRIGGVDAIHDLEHDVCQALTTPRMELALKGLGFSEANSKGWASLSEDMLSRSYRVARKSRVKSSFASKQRVDQVTPCFDRQAQNNSVHSTEWTNS